MNRYTTPIDRAGEYVTRHGEVVRITERFTKGHPERIGWHGWILRTASDGRTHKQWSYWDDVGTFGDAPDFDIVAYVGR